MLKDFYSLGGRRWRTCAKGTYFEPSLSFVCIWHSLTCADVLTSTESYDLDLAVIWLNRCLRLVKFVCCNGLNPLALGCVWMNFPNRCLQISLMDDTTPCEITCNLLTWIVYAAAAEILITSGHLCTVSQRWFLCGYQVRWKRDVSKFNVGGNQNTSCFLLFLTTYLFPQH